MFQYHRGTKKQGTWVFGLCNRDTGEIRLFPVENRNQLTLTKLIRKNVAKFGSDIYSDEWRGYKNLHKHGYRHYTVSSAVLEMALFIRL